MKNSKKSKSLLASILALLVIFISAVLYEGGFITEELYLELINAAGSQSTSAAPVSGKIEVHFIDVGQAECILIQTSEKNVLIDAADVGYEDKITGYLRTEGVSSIDLFITTHPHADHIGSAVGVLEAFSVAEVIMPEIPEENLPTTSLYEKFLIALGEEGCSVSYAEIGEVYDLGDGAALEIFGPAGTFGDNLNNYSIISKLTFGETSFLFTGDAEKKAEKAVLSTSADLSCTVFSAGHHGSSTSNSDALLEAASPKYAVISCGYDNDYGHPHSETLEAFKEYGIEYYRTDYDGDVVFSSDGKTVTVTTSK